MYYSHLRRCRPEGGIASTTALARRATRDADLQASSGARGALTRTRTDLLPEPWKGRQSLPSFLDRMRARYRGFCEDAHRAAPRAARNTRYNSPPAANDRADLYSKDVDAATHTLPTPEVTPPVAKPRFRVVDGMLINTQTGEITDDPHQRPSS